MPNSPTQTTPAEWLLARLTTPTRAAAILGDLLELSATRGRLWFWTAYTRTLIALGWRTPIALVAAYACDRSRWVFIAIHSSMHWLDQRLPRASSRYYGQAWAMPLGTMLVGLEFLLPFVLVRFGPRDRLTRLASAFFLLSLPLWGNRLSGLYLVTGLTAIAVPAALCLREWRRPMIVLAAALFPRYVIFWADVFLLVGHQLSVVWRHVIFLALTLLPIAAAAVICRLLHPWLLERPEAPGPLELAGGTNA
jgi:hypothetical protein